MVLLSILHWINPWWERRQNQGKMYGDFLITCFKDNISDMLEHREHEKGENIMEDIMEVELHIRYPDHYDIPVLPAINIYRSHLMNKKCTREIIELGDQKYSSGRRVHKSLYRKKYYD